VPGNRKNKEMFSYYGSKSKIVDYYPRPRNKKIIEPFAGSARYSLKWFENDILLVDKYIVVVKAWKFLQRCSKKDILSLPILKIGESLDNFDLSEDEKILMGFIVQQGTTGSRKTVSSFAEHCIERNIKNISEQLFKIKHWEIRLDDYSNIQNEYATWFVDPPYQYGGHEYKFSNKLLDYNKLAEWIMNRQGQIIVCENTKATWMPFLPVVKMRGAAFVTTEAIWSNLHTDYENVQLNLFEEIKTGTQEIMEVQAEHLTTAPCCKG
jgi:hypothetical protein